MNEVLINEIESLLPDKLEEVATFIDNLLSTKSQDKLTNQAYQIEEKKIQKLENMKINQTKVIIKIIYHNIQKQIQSILIG